MTIQTIPPTFYQVAFNADPNQNVLPPWWTDISARTQEQWASDRGRQYEFDVNETGMWRTVLANADGALDPSNTASPYAPGVVPYRQARIRCLPGANLLTQDQATAGEGTGFGPGIVPARTNITCGAGYPLTYTASGSAFQGTQVYQVAVPNGAAAPQNLLNLALLSAQPAVAYSVQVQARMLATAQNLTVSVAIDWYNSSAAIISTTSGTGVALTGGSSTWTQLTASGTAPTGTVYCQARTVLGTTTASTATFQADGVQFEQSAQPTLFQVPNTVSANLFPRAIARAESTTVWAPDVGTMSAIAWTTPVPPTGASTVVNWQTQIGTTSTPNLWTGPELGNPNPAQARPSADNVQVTPGVTYTASFWVLRSASADATLALQCAVAWYTASGGYISSPNGAALTLSTTTWGRLAATGAAPAGAAFGRFLMWISSPASTTAINTVYLTGGQFEAASAASTWQDPGAAYNIITPYVERWPQGWDELAGTYGTDDIQAVDAQAGLSQFTLQAPFVAEVMALNPNFFYQLNDPLGSTAVADTAGKRVPAPVENGPFGAGSLVFGNPVTATAVPSGGFQGTPGPVATFANNSNGSGTAQFPETYISLHKTAAVPGPPVSSAFTRIVAFRCSVIPPAGTSDDYNIWFGAAPTWTGGTGLIRAQIVFTTGALSVTYSDNVGGGFGYSGPAVCDGNWHLLAFGADPVSGHATIWLDGAVGTTATGIGVAGGYSTDVLGAQVLYGANQYRKGLVGDLAHAIELPLLLSNTQMTNLYNSWRSASSGESSGARVNRVLTWIGWTGPTAVDTGMTASMGPATDLTGATALDALNNIALTENGNFFVDRNGTLTFKARNTRYGQTVPVYIFGENTAAGEWPFEYLHFEDDPSHVVNSAQVTQWQGPTVTANDAASALKNFPRTYQRTINTTSLPECGDAAQYLLGQNKAAHLRVDVLRLHPSAVPGLFLVCLNLELGTRIRINRRPTDAPQITFDGFIEKIEWSWDPDTADVYVTLQCSPADLTRYWALGALHTTLHAQATPSFNTLSINALPDAAVNRLASSLPAGTQLTIDPGTPIAETLTISPVGIPPTTVGYTSATLVTTTNPVYTHAAGAVVCEVLPTGAVDPTAWDASSVLGCAYAPILSGGAAGTNTVTVGPLPDGAVNALGSTWNVGDVVWLSSGPGLGARTEAATILSVATTYPGYTSCVITFTANLANNHLVGEYVSDLLANNGISPLTVPATARPAY